MLYTPHTLQLFIAGESTLNEKGRPVTTESGYLDFCKCRCDDNGAQKQIGVNGKAYLYNYHIVFEGKYKLNIGDKIRVIDADGKSIRAEGEVVKPGKHNYLNYSEAYL
jgi:hypothetical protein